MTQLLSAYITFDGNTEEAMTFYAAALGGTVDLLRFRDMGMDADGIMHARLVTPHGFHLYASDTAERMSSDYVYGSNVQVAIMGDEQEIMEGYWAALLDGAEVHQPLSRQMWGDLYGQLKDKFGIIWHVNINVPQDAA